MTAWWLGVKQNMFNTNSAVWALAPEDQTCWVRG